MDDTGQFGPSDGQVGKRDLVSDRDCTVCHESWAIPPTSREIKKGVVEPLMVCLHKAVQQKMLDGVYPRLASVCRSDKKLCGGQLWTPVGQPLLADPNPKPYLQLRHIRDEVKPEVKHKQGQYGRNPRQVAEEGDGNDGDEELKRKGKEKFRKPYKVT